MSKQANKTLIGAFVVGALALVVAGILIFGSGDFFAERPKFVMFFEGSVNGLNVGAPVTFRGVKIGTVTEVSLYFNPEEMKLKIPVYVEFNPDTLKLEKGSVSEKPEKHKYLQPLIDRGLRAKLQLQSLVTGLLMVELDFYPDKPARLTGYDPRYSEIPTLSSGLDQLLKKVEKIPLDELVSNLTSAIEGIDRAVNSPKIAESMDSINLALKDVRQIADKINQQIGPIADGVNDTVQEVEKLAKNLDGRITTLARDLDTTLKSATETIVNLEKLTSPGSSANYRLALTLEELSDAARSLQQLADTIERNPESLLRGKKDKGGY
jgi:paraquat-inducible protein B